MRAEQALLQELLAEPAPGPLPGRVYWTQDHVDEVRRIAFKGFQRFLENMVNY